MILVITQICDDCDEEKPTKACPNCEGAYCDTCMPGHYCEQEEQESD